ncbi:hypothetical protein [Geothrix sp. SG200]|uniref:hypothetical protein n=1 Tax=Geothrix sp. SG200 TaxID=2922865 RepID=UPI001FADA7B7|nr:hypothetical protein [Geothrix sp. SG200]
MAAGTLGLLILWSLKSPGTALKALSIGILVTFINPAIAPAQPAASLMKWVLLFVASGRIVAARLQRGAVPQWMLSLAGFLTIAATLALFSSAAPGLSLLKLVTFSVGVVATMWGFDGGDIDRQVFANWFLSLHAAVVIFSLPLLFLPFGYLRNGWAFQGLLNQPQALAIYLAPMTVALIHRGFFGQEGRGWVIPLGLASLVCMGASASRTGAVAMGVAGGLVALRKLAMSRPTTQPTRKFGFGKFYVLVISTVLLLLAFGGRITTFATQFIAKGTEVTTFSSVADLKDASASRSGQVEGNLTNFRAHPWVGVGFGMASEGGGGEVDYDPTLGLPLSAPTEPGFLPLAVLGQTGLIGGLAWLVFLLSILIPMATRTTIDLALLGLAALAVNLGEMIFFSQGGLGLQMWILLGFVHACRDR